MTRADSLRLALAPYQPESHPGRCPCAGCVDRQHMLKVRWEFGPPTVGYWDRFDCRCLAEYTEYRYGRR
jgi:hypothetical protein